MTPDDFRRLLAYDDWANREALASLRATPSPPPRAVALLAHLAAAQTVWLDRLEGRADSVVVWPDWDLDETARRLEGLAGAWRDYLAGLAADQLDATVGYTNQHGDAYLNRVGDILLHLALHGPYHRGQIAALIGSAGGTSAPTDFILAVRRGQIV